MKNQLKIRTFDAWYMRQVSLIIYVTLSVILEPIDSFLLFSADLLKLL